MTRSAEAGWGEQARIFATDAQGSANPWLLMDGHVETQENPFHDDNKWHLRHDTLYGTDTIPGRNNEPAPLSTQSAVWPKERGARSHPMARAGRPNEGRTEGP